MASTGSRWCARNTLPPAYSSKTSDGARSGFIQPAPSAFPARLRPRRPSMTSRAPRSRRAIRRRRPSQKAPAAVLDPDHSPRTGHAESATRPRRSDRRTCDESPDFRLPSTRLRSLRPGKLEATGRNGSRLALRVSRLASRASARCRSHDDLTRRNTERHGLHREGRGAVCRGAALPRTHGWRPLPQLSWLPRSRARSARPTITRERAG